MQTTQETILLFGLNDREKRLVRRLISSFAMEALTLTIANLRRHIQRHPEQRICLVIIHIDINHPHQHRVIQLIRDLVGPFAPILALVPRQRLGEIRRYLGSGADDFIELPLNEHRFSMAFLILLEMGQATMRPAHTAIATSDNEYNKDFWERILHYFAPKSLLEELRRRMDIQPMATGEALGGGRLRGRLAGGGGRHQKARRRQDAPFP